MTAGGEIKETVRCKGRTKDGIRCKRQTVFYPKTCGQHTADFVIKKSTIRGAGRGVFAKRPFARNEKIGNYTGDRMTQAAFDRQRPESAYGYRFKNKVIDAKKTQSCMTRNINDGRSAAKNNSEFLDRLRQNKVEVKATKPIAKGAEIFADYGATYWAAPVKAVKRGLPVGLKAVKSGPALGLKAVKRGPRV